LAAAILTGVLDVAYIVYQTARISVPTVVDSITHRLTRARVDERLHSWGRRIVDRVDMRLEVEGADAVDWSRTYVIMSNHQSYLDIPVLALVIPGSLRFVAKQELFRVPIFGPAMRAGGIVEVDRGDHHQAVASLKRAGEAMRGGINVWIAPEGTRSRSGQLGRLKKGGFVLAKETGISILPLTIDGTRNVMRPDSLRIQRGVPVRVRFGAAIDPAPLSRDELVQRVEGFFRATLGRPD
jgi:1-acyl-sn-glycerol-3-phosphate acyltransferase